MKRLLLMIVIAMTVLTACEASDPYDSEGIVFQPALDEIKINKDCADLQATYDLNLRRSKLLEEGTLNQRRAVKFVKATETRMEEVGCSDTNLRTSEDEILSQTRIKVAELSRDEVFEQLRTHLGGGHLVDGLIEGAILRGSEGEETSRNLLLEIESLTGADRDSLISTTLELLQTIEDLN